MSRKSPARQEAAKRAESFRLSPNGKRVIREVERRDGTNHATSLPVPPDYETGRTQSLAEAFDASYLRLEAAPRPASGPAVAVVDLFCGCGAMSLGVSEACRAIGLRFESAGAFDLNTDALSIFASNFVGAPIVEADLATVLSGDVEATASGLERWLQRQLEGVDLVVAGPPCQGHSNLNNYTRRKDPKNSLYLRVARFARLCRPTSIIVENVTAVRHDSWHVVARTTAKLKEMGYAVETGVLDLLRIGVAQSRRRHVLIARLVNKTKKTKPRESILPNLMQRYSVAERSVKWAIRGPISLNCASLMNARTECSDTTKQRIEYLFKHKIYDLPDHQRPDCHRIEDHTYRSVYGRLKWDAPAPTITCGFDTMGRGRFVHPSQRRTLTPREAARLQFIPDFYRFAAGGERKTLLVELIGNAVPPKLTYVLGLEILR